MKKITIGSAVYDDFNGIYFTYQSLRLNNQDILGDIDFLVIDNNPESVEGKATKKFCDRANIRYIPYIEKISPSVKDQIFQNAKGKFCMSIDSHVLLESDTVKKIIEFTEKNPDTKDLYHGPMFYDFLGGQNLCTHMNPKWRGHMFGTWGNDERGFNPNAPPFEIPMHGCGLFMCKTEEWLGFNKNFKGFGGEEGYIHEKFKLKNRKIWCLPFLRWLHRFDRPGGIKYRLVLEDRIFNYIIGKKELGVDFKDVLDHFKKECPNVNYDNILKEAESIHQEENESYLMTWSKSQVDFKNPSPVKYIKYEILDTIDSFASLSKIDFSPKPKDVKIKESSFENEKNKMENFFEEEGYWLSKKNGSNDYFIIEVEDDYLVSKIETHATASYSKGFIKHAIIYASMDCTNWHKISEIKIN